MVHGALASRKGLQELFVGRAAIMEEELLRWVCGRNQVFWSALHPAGSWGAKVLL
jgi:hypothetical protein